MNNTSYEVDFNAWSLEQADLLRKKDFDHIDYEHLIEEIESLGNPDKRSLRSHMRNLLMHKLKEKYQPERMGKSWAFTINNSRIEITWILEENPSLIKYLREIYSKVFKRARENASEETDIKLSVFPEECPWTLEEILEEKK